MLFRGYSHTSIGSKSIQDVFITLVVPIAQLTTERSLECALQKLFTAEVVNGTERRFKILSSPPVLCLLLSRVFWNTKVGQLDKVLDLVTYSRYLQLQVGAKNEKYSCRGVIFHKGSGNGGHYTCFVHTSIGWYFCDDDVFWPVESNVVYNGRQGEEVYMLVYEKEP